MATSAGVMEHLKVIGPGLPEWAYLHIDLQACREANQLAQQIVRPVLMMARAHVKYGGGALTERGAYE